MSIDVEMDEQETPIVDCDFVDEPPSPDGQREESEERLDVLEEDPIERIPEEPPVKRRPS